MHITFGAGGDFDAVSSASILGHVRTQLHEGATLDAALAGGYHPLAMFIGNIPGSLGETSKLLILLGGLALLWKRIITWHIPAAMALALVAIAGVFHLVDPSHYPDPMFHLLSGTFLLGAFFIATDYVTAPVTARGRLIFGAGCGVLTYVIRTWSAYPEGVGFAVLLMNAATPLIDRYVHPRIFGRTRGGEPLKHPEERDS
jgi:electron transport complex protein RnfD